MNLNLNLYTLSMYSALVPIVFGVIQVSKIRNYLLLLFILVLCSFTSDMLTTHVKATRGYTFLVYTIVQFILLSAIYYHETTSKRIGKIIIYSTIIFILYSTVFIILLKDSDLYFSTSLLISVFFFISVSITTLISIYEGPKKEYIYSYPFFWINIVILLYFSGNIFLAVALNITSMYEIWQLWPVIHNTLNIIKNLIFSVAFWVHYHNHKNVRSNLEYNHRN